MSVLVYTSSSDGKFKKSAFELVSYGKKVAEELGIKLIALTINANDVTELQNYGADTIVSVNNTALNEFNAKEYASVIQQVAESKASKVVVIDSSIDGLYVGPLIPAKC